jgi:uncharacterized protein (DUF2062 family)
MDLRFNLEYSPFGWLAYVIAEQLATILSMNLYLQAGTACLLYFPMVAALLWQFPWIAGTSREELRSILNLKISNNRFKMNKP